MRIKKVSLESGSVSAWLIITPRELWCATFPPCAPKASRLFTLASLDRPIRFPASSTSISLIATAAFCAPYDTEGRSDNPSSPQVLVDIVHREAQQVALRYPAPQAHVPPQLDEDFLHAEEQDLGVANLPGRLDAPVAPGLDGL